MSRAPIALPNFARGSGEFPKSVDNQLGRSADPGSAPASEVMAGAQCLGSTVEQRRHSGQHCRQLLGEGLSLARRIGRGFRQHREARVGQRVERLLRVLSLLGGLPSNPRSLSDSLAAFSPAAYAGASLSRSISFIFKMTGPWPRFQSKKSTFIAIGARSPLTVVSVSLY